MDSTLQRLHAVCAATAGHLFIIRLTFCLYVRLLYEAPLHSHSRLSIRQLDLDLCLNLGVSYSVITV